MRDHEDVDDCREAQAALQMAVESADGDHLAAFLAGADPTVRRDFAKALSGDSESRAARLLEALLARETDPEAAGAIRAALDACRRASLP